MHSTNSEWDRFSIKLFSDKCFISRKCCIIYFSLLKSSRYPVGWIVFSLPKSSRYPWRPCSWNPKKKFCGWRRKKRCSARLLRRASDHDHIMIFVIRSWSDHDLDHQILLKKGHLVINMVISWSRSWSDHDLDHEDRSSWLQSAVVSHRFQFFKKKLIKGLKSRLETPENF